MTTSQSTSNWFVFIKPKRPQDKTRQEIQQKRRRWAGLSQDTWTWIQIDCHRRSLEGRVSAVRVFLWVQTENLCSRDSNASLLGRTLWWLITHLTLKECQACGRGQKAIVRTLSLNYLGVSTLFNLNCFACPATIMSSNSGTHCSPNHPRKAEYLFLCTCSSCFLDNLGSISK